MTVFILGSTGQIGNELSNFFYDVKTIKIPQNIYRNWSNPERVSEISKYFTNNNIEQDSMIFISCGILDPKSSKMDLMNANFHIPHNIIKALREIRPKIITFGSIFEKFAENQNLYISSKHRLSSFIESQVSSGSNLLHLRLHTIFGIQKPKPFMFLGQILDSLNQNTFFKMTSGLQLREYHHVTDEVKAIARIASSASLGITEINHGQPLTLKEIAENIFKNVGKSELLKIGGLQDNTHENYFQKLPKSEFASDIVFRDSIPALTEYIKNFLIDE